VPDDLVGNGRDELTGCVGPVLLKDRLLTAQARAERHDSGVAVFAVDLDRLAAVNAAQGRTAGDRVLIEVARRLIDSLRSTDTCARLGDDSFVVVCEEFDAPAAAFPAADRIVTTLGRPYVLDDGTVVTVTACVGAAVSDGVFQAPDVLLARAARALASAKSAGDAQAVVDVSTAG